MMSRRNRRSNQAKHGQSDKIKDPAHLAVEARDLIAQLRLLGDQVNLAERQGEVSLLSQKIRDAVKRADRIRAALNTNSESAKSSIGALLEITSPEDAIEPRQMWDYLTSQLSQSSVLIAPSIKDEFIERIHSHWRSVGIMPWSELLLNKELVLEEYTAVDLIFPDVRIPFVALPNARKQAKAMSESRHNVLRVFETNRTLMASLKKLPEELSQRARGDLYLSENAEQREYYNELMSKLVEHNRFSVDIIRAISYASVNAFQKKAQFGLINPDDFPIYQGDSWKDEKSVEEPIREEREEDGDDNDNPVFVEIDLDNPPERY